MRTIIVFAVLSSTAAFAQMHRPRFGDDAAPAPSTRGTTFEMPKPSLPHLKTSVNGWGFDGQGFEVRCDQVAETCGTVMVRSRAWASGEAGRLVHQESALPWRGQRVAMNATMRVGSSRGHAQLFVIVEGADGVVLGRYTSKALTGTTSFSSETLAVTVPENAERLVVGVELAGAGALFVKELNFDDAQLVASLAN